MDSVISTVNFNPTLYYKIISINYVYYYQLCTTFIIITLVSILLDQVDKSNIEALKKYYMRK